MTASPAAGGRLTERPAALGKAGRAAPRSDARIWNGHKETSRLEFGFREGFLWTQEELDLIGAGYTAGEIAEMTGRKKLAVLKQMSRLKRKGARKEREDLGNWWLQAACRYAENPDIFFPDFFTEGHKYFESRDSEETKEARAVCGGCEVSRKCLAFAMRREQNAQAGQRYGIWGGLTPVERAALAREWKKGIQRVF